jgi:uncharacterized protein
VKVLEVEVERKRIALTLRLDDEPGARQPARDAPRGGSRAPVSAAAPRKPQEQQMGALADALRRASEKRDAKS